MRRCRHHQGLLWPPASATAGCLLGAYLLFGMAAAQEPGALTSREDFAKYKDSIVTLLRSRDTEQGLRALQTFCQEADLLSPYPQWRGFWHGIAHYIREDKARHQFLEISAAFVRRIETADIPVGQRNTLINETRDCRVKVLRAAGDQAALAEELRLQSSVCHESRRPSILDQAVQAYLYADQPEQAETMLTDQAAAFDERSLQCYRALIALYRGDENVADLYPEDLSSSRCEQHGRLLLKTSRYEEVEWLASRAAKPTTDLRILVANACFEQGKFSDAEQRLEACFGDPRSDWRHVTAVTALLRKLYAARLTLDEHIERLRHDLARLGLNADDRRRRLLYLLWNLELEHRRFADALGHQLRELECTAYTWGHRPPRFNESVWRQAVRELFDQQRYADLCELAETVVFVFPTESSKIDGVAVYAALESHSPDRLAGPLNRLKQLVTKNAASAQRVLGQIPARKKAMGIKGELARLVPPEFRKDVHLNRTCLAQIAYQQAVEGEEKSAAQTLAELERTFGGEGSHPQAFQRMRYAISRTAAVAMDGSDLLLELREAPVEHCPKIATTILQNRLAAASLTELEKRLGDEERLSMDLRHDIEQALDELTAQRQADAPSPEELQRLWDQVAPSSAAAQVIADPGRTGYGWVRRRNCFPVRIHARMGGIDPQTHEIEALVGRVPTCNDMAPSDGMVFFATDAGLLVYRGKQGRWGRLHIPGAEKDCDVYEVVVDNSLLNVRWAHRGESRTAWFNVRHWDWQQHP